MQIDNPSFRRGFSVTKKAKELRNERRRGSANEMDLLAFINADRIDQYLQDID